MERKKRIKNIIKNTFVIFIIIFVLVMFIDYNFFSMNNLPKGNLLKSTKSPNGNYIINFYIVDPIHSTVSSSIRAEIVYDGIIFKKKDDIYWSYRESEVSFQWLNNNEIEINGHTIELPDGEYDFRNN